LLLYNDLPSDRRHIDRMPTPQGPFWSCKTNACSTGE
jgi:hypothetical protein